MHGLAFFKTAFASLFSIVDPIAAVPAFLAIAGRYSRAEQKSIALRACATMLVVLGIFAATGTAVFHFFGITVPAFKIAGGILLFAAALEMMQAKHPTHATPEERSEAEQKGDVGMVPIGIPLLSGPGAIATVTVLAARAQDVTERLEIFGAIVVVAIITLLSFLFGARLLRFLGQTGINIASRIMGLILAAVAIQFVVDGWHEGAKLFGSGG